MVIGIEWNNAWTAFLSLSHSRSDRFARHDKAWRGYEGRNQLWVDDMSPGLETTDAKRVSDSEGSIMLYKFWNSCENERLLRLSTESVSFNVLCLNIGIFEVHTKIQSDWYVR